MHKESSLNVIFSVQSLTAAQNRPLRRYANNASFGLRIEHLESVAE